MKPAHTQGDFARPLGGAKPVVGNVPRFEVGERPGDDAIIRPENKLRGVEGNPGIAPHHRKQRIGMPFRHPGVGFEIVVRCGARRNDGEDVAARYIVLEGDLEDVELGEKLLEPVTRRSDPHGTDLVGDLFIVARVIRVNQADAADRCILRYDESLPTFNGPSELAFWTKADAVVWIFEEECLAPRPPQRIIRADIFDKQIHGIPLF